MFKINNKNNDVVLKFLFLILNILHTIFSASIVDFEQVNISWHRIFTTHVVKQEEINFENKMKKSLSSGLISISTE